MISLKPLMLSGREVLPLIEGGKGISITTGECSGAWAATGGIGTFSAVNADSYDEESNLIRQIYHAVTRRERQRELVDYAIKGALYQARMA
ncbi:MAG: nitronate monooxygenase, partial [Rhodospirillaceae bacterium]|nr:nitronate monooxygenase [Rhodospirillaceae bacterium]